MKHLISAIAAVLCLVAPAQAFDRLTTDALRACHDYVWEVPEFAELPNAAISVFPGLEDGDAITVFWNVYWDDPVMRVAGICTVIDGALEGYENYLDMQ